MTAADVIAQAIRVSHLFDGVPAGQGAEDVLAALEAEGIVLARRTQLAALKPNHGCRVCAWDAGVQGGQSGGYCSGHADEAEAELDALLAQRQAALDIDWAAEVDFYNGSAHYMDVEKVLARVLEGKP